nr:EOG090X0KMN [Daphnia magna]
MENYVKGVNIDPEISLSELPFNYLPPGVVWMKVRPGSKMTNLIKYALKSMEECRSQVWTGVGPAIGKCISCVEIMKRKIPNLHQITKISYHKCEEYWNPKNNELDPIRIVRNIPVLHVLLSSDSLDSTVPGYQLSQPSQNINFRQVKKITTKRKLRNKRETSTP